MPLPKSFCVDQSMLDSMLDEDDSQGLGVSASDQGEPEVARQLHPISVATEQAGLNGQHDPADQFRTAAQPVHGLHSRASSGFFRGLFRQSVTSLDVMGVGEENSDNL